MKKSLSVFQRMTALLLVSITSIAGLAVPSVVGAAAPPGYALVFSDDFNGTALDTNKWQYRTDGKHWSQQQAENVSVSGGYLNIALKKQSVNGYSYTAGGVISKSEFGYGYYEARLKFPPKKGWHSSFWMMDYDGTGTNPAQALQEVDVIENDSINTTRYAANYHKWNPAPHEGAGGLDISTTDLSAGFNTFAVLYLPEKCYFYFNGVQKATYDISRYSNDKQNIWITSIASWLGNTDSVDESVLPSYFQCDWVRYYAPPNLVKNSGFESNTGQSPVNWYEWSPANAHNDASSVEASSFSKMGSNRLKHMKSTAYEVSTKQDLTGLADGNYTLRAMVKRSSGQTAVQMKATGFGGTDRIANIPVSADWVKVEITDINVSNGNCSISFYSNAGANQWLYVDEVRLFKQ